MLNDPHSVHSLDKRRDLIIPGDYTTTLTFCVEHFIFIVQRAIAAHGACYVALSGGSTPQALFSRLTEAPHAQKIDWSKMHLFWGDERTVPPDHPDSNYHMAMTHGLGKMPIPKSQIHRMVAEEKIQENALLYEANLRTVLPGGAFDLVMLGMGEDGHTASLFPHTEGLKVKERWVIANAVPQKNCWRMTLTLACINRAKNIVFYVLGAAKKHRVAEVLSPPDQGDRLPSQAVGTEEHKALWIVDEAAASELLKRRG